jgi:hypothetical protein
MVELHVQPRVSKAWETFCRENPPFSIALDGYVHGPPAFSPEGPHANFDHHANVDRLSTRSTCMQAYMALTMGLFDTFGKDGEPYAHLFVNDPDQDTCLAVWVLRSPQLCEGLTVQTPIARLLIGEDILDCTGGAFPVSPHRAAMEQQAWVFDPYFVARTAGRLPTMGAEEMRGVIDQVGERITALARGRAKSLPLDTRFEQIGGGPGWKMIVEVGPHARTALFAARIRAFVAVSDNGGGSWTYTLGKMSPFVRFPIQDLYARLNEAEGLPPGEGAWGGSNTIGGSPREGGSRLPPPEVERIVNELLG